MSAINSLNSVEATRACTDHRQVCINSIIVCNTIVTEGGLGALPQKIQFFCNFHAKWRHFRQYLWVHVLVYYATTKGYNVQHVGCSFSKIYMYLNRDVQ